MKKSKFLKLTVMMAAFVFMLTACSNSSNETVEPETTEQVSETTDAVESEETAEPEEAVETEEASTVEITDVHGTVIVPVNPKNVVALDNRTFETLSDWGVELAAVPKAVMPAD